MIFFANDNFDGIAASLSNWSFQTLTILTYILMEMTRSNNFLLVSARKFTYQNDKKIGLKADNSIFAKSPVVE